jgi:hypothetical protein
MSPYIDLCMRNEPWFEKNLAWEAVWVVLVEDVMVTKKLLACLV